jgi:hypothetical protein
MAQKLNVTIGLPKIPDPATVDFSKPEETRTYLISLAAAIGQGFMTRPSITTPIAAHLFLSPNGTAYEMKVSDTGVPSFTIAGKRP